MIMGLVAEPMSPAVAVRLIVRPVMVMLVVLVMAVWEREKVAVLPEPVLVQVSVPLVVVVQELTSLVIVDAALVVMLTVPVPVMKRAPLVLGI